MAGAVNVAAVQATGAFQRLFTLRSACAGVKNLLEDEAITVGGSNHSHATQDLYDAISAGDYPEWKLLIQVGAFCSSHLSSLSRALCWS